MTFYDLNYVETKKDDFNNKLSFPRSTLSIQVIWVLTIIFPERQMRGYKKWYINRTYGGENSVKSYYI